MAERELLCDPPEANRSLVGPVLRQAASSPEQVDRLADEGLHQWG